MDNTFNNQKKIRNAELITPPNALRDKVGSGGIDNLVLQRAQELLETNVQDFSPIAEMFLDVLDEHIEKCRKGELTDEEAIEQLIYPTMQLKGQGTMFNYPLVTEICSILVSFLEVIEDLNNNTYDVIMAHKMTLRAVLSSKIKDDGGARGRALVDALKDACLRYFQAHN